MRSRWCITLLAYLLLSISLTAPAHEVRSNTVGILSVSCSECALDREPVRPSVQNEPPISLVFQEHSVSFDMASTVPNEEFDPLRRSSQRALTLNPTPVGSQLHEIRISKQEQANIIFESPDGGFASGSASQLIVISVFITLTLFALLRLRDKKNKRHRYARH